MRKFIATFCMFMLGFGQFQAFAQIDVLEQALIKPKDITDLSLSDITELPKEIGKLKNLQTLTLTNCKFERLPAELFNLKKLYSLTFYETELGNLPPDIAKLKNLEMFVLKGAKLKNLPKEIFTL